MSHPRRFSSAISSVPFLVCESGRRWSDAAKRFIGPFQHAPSSLYGLDDRDLSQPEFRVQAVDVSKVHATIAGHSSVAILWEISAETLPESGLSEIALSIAQIGAGRPDVLQLAAIGEIQESKLKSLSLRIMELGVTAIVRSPDELATIARLVRRRFSASPRVSGHVRVTRLE